MARLAGLAESLKVSGFVCLFICIGEWWVSGAEVWDIVGSPDPTMQGCWGRQ